MKEFLRINLQNILHWVNPPNKPSYMIYLGRDIKIQNLQKMYYVDDYLLNRFLTEQPYFDSYTIWRAEGLWKNKRENTCIIEVFDTDFDIIEKFAQLYALSYYQEAVYIKISDTKTILVENNDYNIN